MIVEKSVFFVILGDHAGVFCFNFVEIYYLHRGYTVRNIFLVGDSCGHQPIDRSTSLLVWKTYMLLECVDFPLKFLKIWFTNRILRTYVSPIILTITTEHTFCYYCLSLFNFVESY